MFAVIPLRDVIPSRTKPVITVLLIVLNTIAFLFELSLTDVELHALAMTYGLVPRHFSRVSLFTSMFLHAGWGHFLGNMLFLWIFGENIEDRMGHGRFLFFYLACGAAAVLGQAISTPDSVIPIIGASGALAGTMGAYFLLFPHSRVLTLVWFVFYLEMIELPAVFFLAVWLVVQMLSGFDRIGTDPGGVAFWAHAVGFLAGMTMMPILKRPERTRIEWIE